MDKKEAIVLLIASLGEIPSLKKLNYDNQKFKLWRNGVETIIKYGLDEDDYDTFGLVQPLDFLDDIGIENIEQSLDYLKKLKDYETALKSIIQKHQMLGIEEKPAAKAEPKEAAESPVNLFDKMQLHPRVIAASQSLFRDGHYASAILEAYKAFNNFVKGKTNLALDGKALMSKVFNEDAPLIKLNELLTPSDRDEQEGFKFLFMGAMVGIRNPKAHDNVIQTDPYKTLEYLGLASLLMRKIEEGKVVRTSQPRRKWDWDSFIKDTKNKCEQKIIDLTKNLYDFTSVNSDSISWGTGINDGSFTFRKLSINGEISIFSVYSCGWVYINFGSMINKTVTDSIIETFRTSLNSIPNINIPKSAITDGKYARIYENPLTNSNNLQIFKDAVLSLCQQLENSKEHQL